MSYSIDTNILLYASDRSSRHHAGATRFLQARADDSELLFVAWPTLLSYVRIATHPRIFSHPLSAREALGNVESLLALPRTRAIAEEDGFLDVYRSATDELGARGNQVPDAHLAAILRQHGVRTLYTVDADFKRFDFLDVRNPL